MSNFLRDAAAGASDRLDGALTDVTFVRTHPRREGKTAAAKSVIDTELLRQVSEDNTTAENVDIMKRAGLSDRKIISMGKNRSQRRFIARRLKQRKEQ